MEISKFNYEENKGLEENLEIDANTFDYDFEEDFDSNEDYAYKSDDGFDSYGDFFNGSSTEPSSFNDREDDFFEGAEFSGSLFGDNLFDDDTFESLDNKQMKKFLSKWFKIFAGLGVCLTVLGVLLNNVLKRK